MKKKIIYGLLLAVAMVTASSSFVSCKDYEGDDYAALTNRNAVLSDSIKTLDDLLKQQIIALQNCSTNCANQHQQLWDALKEKQEKGDYATNAKVKADSLVLAQAISKNTQAIATLNAALKADSALLAGRINDLAAKEKADSALLAGRIDKTETDIADLAAKEKADSAEFMRLINENSLAIIAARALAQSALDLAKQDSVRIDELTTDFNSFINVWGSDLASAIEEAAKIRATVANDSAIWNLAALNAQAAKDTLEKYQLAWNLAAEQAQAAKDSLDKYQEAWNNAVVVADKAYDFVKGTKFNNLQELIDAYEQADQAMSLDIAALQEEVGKLKNTLAKMITGVIIQATYSPVLGNGSLPFSVQTNLLAAYAGKSTQDVDFPSSLREEYVDGVDRAVISETDQAYLQGLGFWPNGVSVDKGDYIINGTGNAGKVYLTVNPTNTDFTGTTFDLVNSAGQVSRMELSDLQPCKDVLNFGWTRAGASASTSGFYEASATVTKENIEKLQANINVEMFQKAFKENLNSPANGTGYVSYTAMMDLARAVYSSLEPLQRNGIRATWMDDAMGVSRSYTSAFDIAATVVNPLGFNFSIPESKFTRFPVFDTEYLKNRFHLKGDFSIQNLADKATGEKHIYIVVEDAYVDAEAFIYDLNGHPVTYDGYAVVIGADGLVWIDVTDMYNEIYGDLCARFATGNDLIRQANKRIDYMVSYIDRYNRKAVKANKWITSANNMLQPVLLWCDSENVGVLGGMITGNYAAGTVVPAGGAVALVPTTYTLELLAPAYKKSILVTNVYQNGKSAQGAGGDWQEALKAVNEALKKGGFDLFEGQSLKNAFIFEAKPEYAGMTFEFAYTALDFAGKIAGRKFYLTVGE